jgi:hypothetical protein
MTGECDHSICGAGTEGVNENEGMQQKRGRQQRTSRLGAATTRSKRSHPDIAGGR